MRCKKAGEKCFDRNGEAFVPDQAEMTTADGGGRHKLSIVHSHTRAFSRAVGLMKQGYAINRNLRRKSVRAMNMFNKEQFVRARQRSTKAPIYVISQIGPPVGRWYEHYAHVRAYCSLLTNEILHRGFW